MLFVLIGLLESPQLGSLTFSGEENVIQRATSRGSQNSDRLETSPSAARNEEDWMMLDTDNILGF